MVAIFAKHLPYEDGHLGEVVEQMRRIGAPTLRVVPYDGAYMALEGSHRLAACDHLGLEPLLLVETPDMGEETTAFWSSVAPNLPRYDITAYLIDASIGSSWFERFGA